MTETLCFIGGGNMARSLIGGLIARDTPANSICVADPASAVLEALRRDFGVRIAPDNLTAARGADVVLLAVKPQSLRAVVTELREVLKASRPLLISVAAGVRAVDIQRWSDGVPVVRCMPNRPALQGCGISGLFATAAVPDAHRQRAERILCSVGQALWLEEESHMDAVTAVSGSGPAYFFLLIEMLEQAGIELGLPAATSRQLATETAYGSGLMAREATQSAATLREQVTSKGGTTEAALNVLENNAVRAIFTAAVTAAARRSAQLADELGSDASL